MVLFAVDPNLKCIQCFMASLFLETEVSTRECWRLESRGAPCYLCRLRRPSPICPQSCLRRTPWTQLPRPKSAPVFLPSLPYGCLRQPYTTELCCSVWRTWNTGFYIVLTAVVHIQPASPLSSHHKSSQRI